MLFVVSLDHKIVHLNLSMVRRFWGDVDILELHQPCRVSLGSIVVSIYIQVGCRRTSVVEPRW